MKSLVSCLAVLFIAAPIFGCSMNSSDAAELSRADEAREALTLLYKDVPGARELASNAEGILIFPEITKAGFVVGGQYGTGTLFRQGKVSGYYRSTAASYGLQAGVQKFGYAMFFMSPEDMKYLSKSDGWEIGVGPSITVVDRGMASSFTTTSSRKGVYVFFFEQRGLMAGLGIQGTKITKLDSNG